MTGTVDVTLEVPHPILYGVPRTTEGQGRSGHSELTASAFLQWDLMRFEHVTVAIAAGPTFHRLSQELVTEVSYLEEYPYDAIEFESLQVARETVDAVGRHSSRCQRGYRIRAISWKCLDDGASGRPSSPTATVRRGWEPRASASGFAFRSSRCGTDVASTLLERRHRNHNHERQRPPAGIVQVRPVGESIAVLGKPVAR